MAGGLLQLVAYGIQDLIFTHSPQITFFKTVYKRYTNFTIDQQLLEFNSNCNFGQKNKCIIQKNGDLLGKLYLRVELPSILIKYKKSNIERLISILKEHNINLNEKDIIFDISNLINPTDRIDKYSFGDFIADLQKEFKNKDIDTKEINKLIDENVQKIKDNNIIIEQKIRKLFNEQLKLFETFFIPFIKSSIETKNKSNFFIIQELKLIVSFICNNLNKLDVIDRLKLIQFPTENLCNYIDETIEKIENFLNINMDNSLNIDQVTGELLNLKNIIIKCVPYNSEYISITDDFIEDLVSNISDNLSIEYIGTKLKELKTKIKEVNYILTVIENEVYQNICYNSNKIIKNEDTLLRLQSVFDNPDYNTIDKLYYEISKILLENESLLNNNPILFKIYTHLTTKICEFKKLESDELLLDTFLIIIERIKNNLKKYIFRKITIDELVYNEENNEMVSKMNIDLIDTYLFGIQKPIKEDIEDDTIISKFDGNLWAINKSYYIRYTSESVEFLDIQSLNLILTIRNKKGVYSYDNITLDEYDIKLYNFIKDNIYSSELYFSNMDIQKRNITFIDNIGIILDSLNVIKINNLKDYVINNLNVVYDKDNYKYLDAYIAINNLLEKDNSTNFSLKKSEYIEIIIKSLKYNFHLYNNIFRILCSQNLVIDQRYNINDNNFTEIKYDYNNLPTEFDSFIGNLEFDKIINNKYNKIRSILFFKSWGNFYKILSDNGNLNELINKEIDSHNISLIKNYNVLFNYVELIFKIVIERISKFYSSISNKHVLQFDNQTSIWDPIKLDNNKYYINKIYLEYNNEIKNQIIKNLDNILDQYTKFKHKSIPDPIKLVSIKLANGEIYEKNISFCNEIRVNSYECFELVPLNDGTLSLIQDIVNNIKDQIDDVNIQIEQILDEIINNDIEQMDDYSEENIAHFLFTHYNNGSNFSGLLPNSRLNTSNIIKYYKKKILDLLEENVYYKFDNEKYTTDIDNELHTVYVNLINICVETVEDFEEYNKIKINDFLKYGYKNTITPDEIIDTILKKIPIKLKDVQINNPPKNNPPSDIKQHDYTYILYKESRILLKKNIDSKIRIPYLIETELMYDEQFSWFYKTILDEWVARKYVGSVIFDSLGKIKSFLRKDTDYKYNIVDRYTTDINNPETYREIIIDEISPNINNMDKNKLLECNVKTRRLLNRFVGNPYNNISKDEPINDILENEYKQSCFVEDSKNIGILEIYEKEKIWLSYLDNTVNNNISKLLSRKEVLKKILNNLLFQKYNNNILQKIKDDNIDDYISDDEKKILDYVNEYIKLENNQTEPSSNDYINEETLFCQIVIFIFGTEMNKYTTIEDFFGYKSEKIINSTNYDRNLIYTNNFKDTIFNKFDSYTVIQNNDNNSYYYTNTDHSNQINCYLYLKDPIILNGISTIFPVLYYNNEDKFPFSFLNYEIDDLNDSGQKTYIEKDFGRILRQEGEKYFFIDNRSEAVELDIYDSDEYGNLLQNKNLIEREWILTEDRNKLYYYYDNLVEKYVYEKDNVYYEEDTNTEISKDAIQLIRPLYRYDVDIINNEQTYDFLIESEIKDPNGSYLWKDENIYLLFNDGDIRLDYYGNFTHKNGNNFIGDISTLIPKKANKSLEKLDEPTPYAKKIIFKKYGIGDLYVIVYSSIVETYNLEISNFPEQMISDFPEQMIYNPDLEKPIRLLNRITIDRTENKEILENNNLRILKDTSFDINYPKIQIVKDRSNRKVFMDPTENNKIVVQYPAEFIIENNEDQYKILPLYDGLIFEGEPTLIPVTEIIKSDIFDSGDNDGISKTFNDSYPYDVDEYSEIFCPLTVDKIVNNLIDIFNNFTTRINKLNVTETYLEYIINISKNRELIRLINTRLKNSEDLFQNLDQNKENILNLINEDTRVIEQKIDNLKEFLTNNGKIIQILTESNIGKFAWIRRLGHFIIDEVDIYIGDQLIDKQYGIWLNTWYELTKNPSQINGYNNMIGDIPELYTYNNKRKPEHVLYIPLQFWFCSDSGLYLPLVGLQYCEVTLNLKLRSLDELAYWEKDTDFITLIESQKLNRVFKNINQENILENNFVEVLQKPTLNCNILAQYIYLEDKERKIFSKSRHEYLIHQLQYNGGVTVSKNKVDSVMFFNSPCKEFIWNVQLDKFINGSLENGEKQWYNYSISKYDYNSNKIIKKVNKELIYNNQILYKYTDYGIKNYTKQPNSTIFDSQIKILGNPRIISKKENGYYDSKYLNYVQPYQHHSHTPSIGINLYSFAINPEHYQPSGTINMTKIDDAFIRINMDPSIEINEETNLFDKKDWGKLFIFTRNYNVLRILSGMAGLAFSF